MATTNLKAYNQTIQPYLSTGLNSLANGATLLGAAIDNSSDLAIWIDFEIVLATQGSARAAGATCSLFFVPALDGTNYTDGDTNDESAFVFPLSAATTAQRKVRRGFELAPLSTQKFLFSNNTGQALAASGNSVNWRARSLTTA